MKKLAYSLILIPILLITLRVISSEESDPGVISDTTYKISILHPVNSESSLDTGFFIPSDNYRQEILIDPGSIGYSDKFQQDSTLNQRVGRQGDPASDSTQTFSFLAKTKSIKFEIHNDLEHRLHQVDERLLHLLSTDNNPLHRQALNRVSDKIDLAAPVRVKDLISGLFETVQEIPTAKNSARGDAISCQEQAACSEEAKSRLLTEMFRSAGIPARLVGGLVLDESTKVGLDYWVQANIGNQWVTFDPERGHFAELPASHLEIFRGEMLPTNDAGPSTSNLIYVIEKERNNVYASYALLNIWNLIDVNELPFRPITILLLLPLGAYIVAICTNVVGFKTYGVFLPVLIAFAFITMGLLQGLLFFTVIIGLISLMSFPLERWGILHTPKLVCLLTAVGLYCLAAVKLFYVTGWVEPSATLTFPIIILTLIAERFAQKVEEESLTDALFIYSQTLVVTLMCYLILSANVIQHAFITFPELLIGIAGLSLLLGKWIGLQLSNTQDSQK